jgi:hypothetical protein
MPTKTPEARHVFRTVTDSYSAVVFIIVTVEGVATALNGPMEPVSDQNTLSVDLLRYFVNQLQVFIDLPTQQFLRATVSTD